MAELHEFQLYSTMDSKTKLAEFLTPCQKHLGFFSVSD